MLRSFRLLAQGMSVIEVAELANKKGSHTKIIEFLKSDLETWLVGQGQQIIGTRSEAHLKLADHSTWKWLVIIGYCIIGIRCS